MNTPIYQLTREYDGYYVAQVLSIKSNRPTEIWGHETPDEFDAAIKEQYGPDTVRVSKRAFQEELEKRAVHTPVLRDTLTNSYMGDLSAYHVYGAPMRPMSAVWARIDGAVYINVDKQATGYHTYVVVPQLLDKEVIERYELVFISHPKQVSDEQ